MPASDLPILIEAAREAGKVALGYTGSTARKWDKPGDLGIVTEADIAVDALLCQRLRAARPEYGWLSEETEDDPDRLTRKRTFIVDPIDGTRSFAEGSKTWAHAIAVAEDGIVTAAVVYLPALGLLYTAAADQGATLNDRPLRASVADRLDRAEILAARPMLAGHHWLSGAAPEFRRAYRPSLAYRMALVAEGRFDGMLTLRPTWEWDIAAGDLILREAGAVSSDRSGAPLRFNNKVPQLDGIVAAGPVLHASITGALAPSGNAA